MDHLQPRNAILVGSRNPNHRRGGFLATELAQHHTIHLHRRRTFDDDRYMDPCRIMLGQVPEHDSGIVAEGSG